MHLSDKLNHSEAISLAWIDDMRTTADRETRIRAALVAGRGPLPRVEAQWLRNYYEYLIRTLILPIKAQYFGEVGPSDLQTSSVTVIDLLPPGANPDHEREGLACKARLAGEEVTLPLVHIEVPENHPMFQALEDYWYWFWNWRFDPRI